MGYPEGVKGCKLRCTEPGKKKCLIIRDVTINEEQMPLKTENTNSETQASEKTQTQVEFEGNHQYNSDYRTDESEENSFEESHQTPPTQDYQLIRDKEKRQSKACQTFGYTDLIAYALSVTSELTSDEPVSYKEAIMCDQRTNWIKVMEAEMLSLSRNNTWTLVRKPKNQKLVCC